MFNQAGLSRAWRKCVFVAILLLAALGADDSIWRSANIIWITGRKHHGSKRRRSARAPK